MTLEPGVRLGSYQIVSALGVGGMGEVYRAHDTALGRDVAIKVVPAHFATDPDRLARFEREARTLAALNHPNIAAIYGLERAGTASVLVMELAEGETLAARIARGQVPVDDAVAIALQIAAALEAAHEKGVVHRDLKPANIVVSPSGRVKVLDFGLAKLAAATDNDSAPFSAANSPTIAASMTGTILGTAAYMSPEQARGKAVDKRTDIWAFGCVLFEMLAGAPAFAGDTITDIVAAVVKNEPDWRVWPRDTPASFRTAVGRCLRKDPDARFHDIADVRIEIQEGGDRQAIQADRGAARSPWLERAIVAVVAAAIGSAAMWSVARLRTDNRPSSTPVTRLEINLPSDVDLYGGGVQSFTLSPDGRRIAFLGIRAGVRQIYVRSLDGFDAAPLRGTDQAQSVFFSPDGASIGFITPDRYLKRVALSDGLVVTIAHDADQYSGADWGPGGRITFNRGDGPLHQVAETGGTVQQLTSLDEGRRESVHMWPSYLPAGNGVLFATLAGDDQKNSRIDGIDLRTGKRRDIVAGTAPRYLPSGHLVFLRDQDLLAAPFDLDRLEPTGPAVRILEKIGLDFSGSPLVAVSQAGTLAYVPTGTSTSRLLWVSRDGAEQPVTDLNSRYQSPRLAPDGQRIAMSTGGSLWVHDSARGTMTRMTTDDTIGVGFNTWDPDGSRIVFRSRTGMRWIDVNSGTASKPIQGSKGIVDIPNSIAPDRDTVAFGRQDSETSGDIYLASISGRFPPRPVVRTPAYEGGPQFSPDGRWLAYSSNESGRFQVYVRALDESEHRLTVSSDGGSYVLWRRDGKELFYRNGNKLMAVGVASNGSSLTLSTPHVLFDRRYGFETSTIANYDINLDGTRFLMMKDEVGAGRINLVLNWFEELKRLAPVVRH